MNKVVLDILIFVGVLIISAECSGCAPPLLATNQIVYGSKTKMKDGYTTGEKFYYKCRTGYHFEGSTINSTEHHKLECIHDDWSPLSLTPCLDSCNGKCRSSNLCAGGKCICEPCGVFRGEFCKKAERCKTPEKPRHGNFEIVSVTTESDDCTVKVGTQLTFSCQHGYQINRGSSYSLCTETGWSYDPPVCEQVLCREEETSSLRDHGSYYPMSKTGTYTPGKIVTFTCNEHYRLVGASTSLCVDGNWQNPWPSCVEKTCNAVILGHGEIFLGSNSYSGGKLPFGSKLSFVCLKGYVLVGSDHIQCMMSRGLIEWSSHPPRCMTYEDCVDRAKNCEDKYNPSKSSSNGPSPDDQNNDTSVFNRTGKPLTIVTATAGGLLLLLLLVITIVACQRRRLNRMRRGGRSGHRRLSGDEDRMSFVYYSNDVHVVLPSYDEAMQNRRINFPPPYAQDEGQQDGATERTTVNVPAEATAAALATTAVSPPQTTEQASTIVPLQGENIYETIGDNAGAPSETISSTPEQIQPNQDAPLLTSEAEDTTAAASEIQPPQNSSENDALPKMKLTDYTRYDGPPNEQIYARISEIMRDGRGTLRGAAPVGLVDHPPVPGNENTTQGTGNDDIEDGQVNNYDDGDDDFNSDTEALLKN